jgi:hypothetical protein
MNKTKKEDLMNHMDMVTYYGQIHRVRTLIVRKTKSTRWRLKLKRMILKNPKKILSEKFT